jgi:uncharacterized protein
MSVICNTTVLSNFASISQVEILRQLFRRLFIPKAVYEEIHQGLDEGYRFYRPLEALIYPVYSTGWIEMTAVAGEGELRALAELPRKIHAGEAECLVLQRDFEKEALSEDEDCQ